MFRLSSRASLSLKENYLLLSDTVSSSKFRVIGFKQPVLSLWIRDLYIRGEYEFSRSLTHRKGAGGREGKGGLVLRPWNGGGGVGSENECLVLSTKLIMSNGHRKEIRKPTFRALARANTRNVGFCISLRWLFDIVNSAGNQTFNLTIFP